MPNFNDRKSWVDMTDWFTSQGSYTDFEGLSETSDIIPRVDKAISEVDEKVRPIVRTLLCHWVHGSRSEADTEWNDDQLKDFAFLLEMVVRSRWFMKEG